MFTFIRHWLERRIINRSLITEQQWQQAITALPLLKGLSDPDMNRLKELVILFIERKSFEGAHDLVVSLPMVLIISLQACLPVLKLNLNAYDGWTSIIVYPAGFSPERKVVDEYGVTHFEKKNLAGESWLNGPVVLAWDEAEHAGVIDGSNLVIHEFAHKLDMENGVANGFPALHREMLVDDWVNAFSEGYTELESRCQSGKSSEIDCYGASSPAEFFAVLSEVFFERPQVIRRHYPRIHTLLQQYYRQDTLSRLAK